MSEFNIPKNADTATVSLYRIDFEANEFPVATITDQHPQFAGVHAHVQRRWERNNDAYTRPPVGRFVMREIDDAVITLMFWASKIDSDLLSFLRLIGIGFEYTIYQGTQSYQDLALTLSGVFSQVDRYPYCGGTMIKYERDMINRREHRHALNMAKMRYNDEVRQYKQRLQEKDYTIDSLQREIDRLSRKLHNGK